MIVGAGPGGVEQLTLRAYDAIVSAEILLVDALVDPIIVSLASCKVIHVGKRGGDKKNSILQSDLNTLLIQQAKTGAVVVRLKGGDPCIFGRLDEEIQALKNAGISYEIINGLSSILTTPAILGMSLTSGKTVVLVSGHDVEALDYPTLSKMDTIVLVMATRNWKIISQRLIQAGLPSDTSISIVRSCHRLDQEIVLTNVSNHMIQLKAPSVIIISKTTKSTQTCG